MPQEIELKFSLTPGDVQRLASVPLLARCMADAKVEKLTSVYFDTADRRLRDKGLSLRVRHEGATRLQTIKVDGAKSHIASRGEWECEIDSDKPDLGRVKKTPVAPFAGKKLASKLRPVFETRVTRMKVQVPTADAMIELAIDRGRVVSRKRSSPISEIELELKDGDPKAVVAVAKKLAKALPLRLGLQSKAERGYALAGGAAVTPLCAEEITLADDAPVAEAFSLIGLSCLRHIALNEKSIHRRDAEGVHQMRVGLRRLRAAFSLFKECLEDKQSQRIKAELKWLTEELGPARDMDVFVDETIEPMRRTGPRRRELASLEQTIRQKRAEGLDRARRSVHSDRFRALVVESGLWLAGGEWRTHRGDAARREQRVLEFASRELARQTKKIVKQIKELDELDDTGRHKLRIAIKKLRYASEFFESLFPGKKAKERRERFGESLMKLQGALGRLNDIRVHARLVDRVVYDKKLRRQADATETSFGIGLVTGREQTEVHSILADAKRAGVKLARVPHF